MLLTFYFSLRVCTLIELNGGTFQIELLNEAFNKLYLINTPLIITRQSITISIFVSIFLWMVIEAIKIQNKKNLQENTHGSSDWETPNAIKELREEELDKNQIFTSTEIISKNMRISKRNRHVILLGRPGTGKSRNYMKPNLLNSNETIVVTDPKGELLRDCGMSLVNRGYTIHVLNLVEKWKSDNYNPLMYIKKIPKEAKLLDLKNGLSLNDELSQSVDETKIAEDDVMTLINTIMLNTKSETIESNTGDPFWEKAEMVFLQALIYYVLFNYQDKDKNFKTVLELIRLGEPDKEGNSQLRRLFDAWETKDPGNIGVKQWKHFVVSASSPKMMSTIIMTASARLAPFNISEIEKLTTIDTMELNRIGKAGDEGKVAYFIITSPNDSTFNFIANIMYSQIFTIIDVNASQNDGSLAIPCTLYMDEWSQLGVIPRFIENLAYVRGLNCGITICLQSLSQLKKVYKDSWETALDCCDYILFLGSRSKETLEYFSMMLGKKTWYKKSSGRTYSKQGSSSLNWDVVGRELAFVDELARMDQGMCILLMSGMRPFYSKVYNLKQHPRYSELYEPWNKEETKDNKYDHLTQKEISKSSREKKSLFNELGLSFVKINSPLESRKLTSYEVKNLSKEIYLSTSSLTDRLLFGDLQN